MADLHIDVQLPSETINNGFRSRFPEVVNRLVRHVRRRLGRNSMRGTLGEESVGTSGSHSTTPMAERNLGTNNQSFSGEPRNNNSPSPVNRGTSGRVTSPVDSLHIDVEPSAEINNQTSSGQPAVTDNQSSSITKVYRALRPRMKPGAAGNVGVMLFLTWVAIRSEGEARFPFQTHPKTTRIVITTLTFYGVFSAADWVISAVDTEKGLQDGENSKKKREKSARVEPSGTRKAQQQQSRFKSLREDELQGPPSRTRASLKRRHYEPSSTKLKVEKKVNQEDQSIKGETDAITEEPLGASSITQPLPDKQTLELIIDTLQRKDIYEIFAEPVDPEEVEDYYEIIEEPMDFGTMRAKLHEGLYTSLEQFEHDVFLISGNAMHFNSSGTIFFRQAHGIDKLAKRVFHVLRTNPENFESEFSGSRRRSCRRSQDEIHKFNSNFFSKASEKTSTATVDASLKNTNSLIHTSFLENPRIAKAGGDGKRCDPIEVDRRSTYKPDLNLNNDTWPKSLIHLNQHEHSYSQSLMQFVKDLGPTAQMVARRKLQNITVNPQPTMRELGKQPQLPTGQMWFNSSRSISSNGSMNLINRDNVFERDESSRHGMVMSCSSGRMDSVITSASSVLPAWLRQEPCASRFAVVSGSLRSNFGRINEGRECEEGSGSYNKPFDPRDLTLQL